MKNKLLIIIGLILVIAATVVAYFTDIQAVDYSALIVSAAGCAVTVLATFRKSEKHSWKEIVAIVLFTVGTMLLIFAGLSEATVISIYTGVAGVISLIIGLIVSLAVKKE